MKRNKESKAVWVGGLAMALVLGLCLIAGAQEETPPPEGSIAIGVSFEGFWLDGGDAVGMLGGSLAIGLTEELSFVVHYARKSVDFLGLELGSLSVLDVVTSYAPRPSGSTGLYIFAGGGYMTAEVIGTGTGDILIGGGLGLRFSVGSSGLISIQYRLRMLDFGETLMHAVEGGISLSF